MSDADDVFPFDGTEAVDTDLDGIGNNADTDDDNDGVLDAADAFPIDATESVDTDLDGIGNNADSDDDNDGIIDITDVFPLDENLSSGLILEDYIWPSGSYVYVNGKIQVAKNVKLTIQSNSVIEGNNNQIDVFGELNILGLHNEEVIVRDLHINPGNNDSSENFKINIVYANLKGGSLYNPSGNSIYGSLTLKRSVINYDRKNTFYLWYPTSDVLIEHNRFIGDVIISTGHRDADVFIRHNVFNQYQSEVIENWAAYGDSMTIVEYNTFGELGVPSVKLRAGYDSAAMTAINNYWSTKDIQIIENMIFDKNDDLSSSSVIPFEPYLSEPNQYTLLLESSITLSSTEKDSDGDGVFDDIDTFILDYFESVDTDSDGIGNNADTDDDNDGILDIEDEFPLNPNFAPKMLSNIYFVDEDMKLNSSIDATDIDSEILTYTLTSNVSNGSLFFSTDGSFEYIPNANYFGKDSFSASVSDGELSSEVVKFEIQITGINDAPSVTNISKKTRLDNPITFFIDGEDIDSEELVYSVISSPLMGSATIGDNGTLQYTPKKGALGIDEFEIQVSDGELTSSAIVTIDNNLSFKGSITGGSYEDAEILLTGDGYLLTTVPDSLGNFKFYGLPDGEYAVKVRKGGYKSSAATTFALDIREIDQSLNKIQQSKQAKTSVSSSTDNNVFSLVAIDSENFSFHWEEDQSTAGFDYAANINEPLIIEFLGEPLTIVDDSSANQLHHDLNILLVDSGEAKWTQEHAYRIAETMKSIPQERRDPYKAQTLMPSRWYLTNDFIEDDIQVSVKNGYKTVIISAAVFVNATPKIAKIEDKRGVFYSQRLHHALVRFVTNNGSDVAAYEKILTERYGVTTLVPDYSMLTYPTGNESSGRFQSFHAEEIVKIINMFEEMPKGMHKLPELKYLIRRLDGTPHPFYDEAPAVAWADAGYIEFMESAFNTSSVQYVHRLIIHEKAHFLWEYQFDGQLKVDWIELGGWYEDSNTTSGWATSNQTEFVSAYAHSKNPNEDMAESISYFIVNPDLLKSRAIRKYEFVRDRIMQGNIYISQINENFTFQVYNLFPDYVFPGKIKRLDISVNGMPELDKTVTIEIELHALNVDLEGAKLAYLRVFSEIGTYKDIYLYPVDENGFQLSDGELSTILQGSFTLSKFAKAGFWRTQQIIITDSVGNQRMEGANDFGWKLYVNNPLEDAIKPEYVIDTASLSKSKAEIEGQEVQVIHAKWQVNENKFMSENSPCYASMNDEILSTYRVEGYGTYDEFDETCNVDFIMPDYMPSSNYSMNYIKMYDLAMNQRGTYFTNSSGGLRDEDINLDELPQQIELVTNEQDIEQPELDLNNIEIIAMPTNPDAPDGETVVTVTFSVRDNISGYNIASLTLRDPQGTEHQYWVYNEDTWSLFPSGDVTQWHTYTRNIILPVGSAPGTWGMSEMTIYDRAGNFKGYDFTEIVHFDVTD